MTRVRKVAGVKIQQKEWDQLIDDYISQSETGYKQKIPFPQEASYIIMKEDNTIYAINGKTGKADYLGTVASTVIQSAIDALTDGGKIFIKKGTYTISAKLSVSANIAIYGENNEATTLQAVAGLNDHVVSMDGNPTLLANFKINGNRGQQTAGSGVFLSSATGPTWLLNLRITECYEWGVETEAGSGETFMFGNIVWNNGGNLALTSNSDSHIIGNSFYGVYTTGRDNVLINDCFHVSFADNFLEYGKRNALTVYASKEIRIIGNDVGHADQHGISIMGASERILVAANNVFDNNRINGDYDGIRLGDSGRYIIIGNYVYDSTPYHRYAIRESGTDNNVIENNIVQGFVTDGILKVGTNTIVRGNIGYITENSGTATFSGDGTTVTFTIPHGLASTPTYVSLEAKSSGAVGDKYWSADATNITVTFITAPPSGTNNIVIGWKAEV